MTANCPGRPAALLTNAEYYGTLAGVRALGAAGIPVHVADRNLLAPARWSRFATRTLGCPAADTDGAAFVAWLIALGEREPGMVLLPTSDHMAWLLALHRDALGVNFRVASPSLEAVYSLLNKWRLREACFTAGLDSPWTVLPADDGDLARVSKEAPFPLVVKPQTQVGLWPHQKGRVVRTGGDLEALYTDLRVATRVQPELLALDPGAARPIVQAFAPSAADGIYSLSGFVDRSRQIFLAQGARKVLQRPKLLGVGLCFEEADVVPHLAVGVERLCHKVGFDGVFEVEFVELDGRFLVIDFNPRFFGQMAFDIGRGVNLPLLAYLRAIGDDAGLARLHLEAAAAARGRAGRIFCNRIQLGNQMVLRRLARTADDGEYARWNSWLRRDADLVVDSAWDRSDWKPGAVDLVRELLATIAHPRSSWRDARRG